MGQSEQYNGILLWAYVWYSLRSFIMTALVIEQGTRKLRWSYGGYLSSAVSITILIYGHLMVSDCNLNYCTPILAWFLQPCQLPVRQLNRYQHEKRIMIICNALMTRACVPTKGIHNIYMHNHRHTLSTLLSSSCLVIQSSVLLYLYIPTKNF